MSESSSSSKPPPVASGRFARYSVLLNVRPEGSLGVFDPHALTVTAISAETAIAVATAEARTMGWEVCGASIASVGRA